MRTYNPKKRHGGTAFFRAEKNDVVKLLCGEVTTDKDPFFSDTEKYLKSFQREDGSFGHDVEDTAQAVLSLKAIGCEDEEVFERAQEYLVGLENAEGSFGRHIGTVDETAWVILALRATGYYGGRLDKPCNFIKGLQNPDGGFGLLKGDSSDLKHTALVLIGLRAAGTPESDMPAAKDYVLKLKQDNGGFAYNEAHKDSNTVRTSYGVLALLAMDGSPELIPAETKDHIRKNGQVASILDIYSKVTCRFGIGDKISEEYADFATKLKNADGGFGWSASDRKSNIMNTFYGVMTLKTVSRGRKRQ